MAVLDIVPTVLDLAGIEAPHRHFGRSLLPLLDDPSAEHRVYAFTDGGFSRDEEPQFEQAVFPYDLKAALQHEQPHLVGRAIAVRDKEWTYVWRLYEEAELYHRASDPDERSNLAGCDEHSSVEHRMQQAMLRWLADTSDVIPADEDPRYPPSTSPCRPDSPARTAPSSARRTTWNGSSPTLGAPCSLDAPQPQPCPGIRARNNDWTTSMNTGQSRQAFRMGTEDADANPGDHEGPIREAAVKAFAMDTYAVASGRFAAFVEGTGHCTEAEKYGWSFVFAAFLSVELRRVSPRPGNTSW